MDVQAMKADYDWREAFGYASGFTMDDVAEVLAASEGENDGPDWKMAGRLTDGRFFILRAGCDYTGWDCQAGGDSELADSLDILIRWRMTDDDRARLGYTLPPETDGAPLPVTDPQP